MESRLVIGLLLLTVLCGLWGAMYARRAYENTKKILEKLGK
jgi:hypothetical protein